MEHCHGHSVSPKAVAKSHSNFHEGFGATYAQTSQQNEGMEVAVAKVKNNAEISTKELEAKRT